MKKYVDDTLLSWEERYKRLEAYHLEAVKDLQECLELEFRLRCELYDDWHSALERTLSICKKYEMKIRKMEK